jgi:hypothetical protein
MRIESGPTGERKVRTLLMLLMVGVFAVWFAYDGWIGWPGANYKEHLEQIPANLRKNVTLTISDRVKPGQLDKIKTIVRGFELKKQRTELTKLLGAPPVETPERWFFFGPCHRIEIILEDGRLVKAVDRDTARSDFSIWLQKALAVGLGVLTLFLIWFVARVRATRLVVDDDGLTINSVGPIPWDQMTALDISRFAKKGCVELVYNEQGAQRRVRLDEYHFDAFDDVIDAICARKGFDNPLPVKEAQGDSTSTPVS